MTTEGNVNGSAPGIVVVGSFAVGLTIRTDRVPVFGETLIGSDFDMGPGGKGSNQAVGVARLGARAQLVGMVGTDKLADIAHDLYGKEGVGTEHLYLNDARPTGVGVIVLNSAGDNFIILDMGANEQLDAGAVDRAEDAIASADVVMSVLEVPEDAAARAMELGRRHGRLTILNPAPARRLRPETLANVDVLTPNETELRVLLGLPPDDPTPTEQLVHRLLDSGVRTVVVTLGSAGALVLTDDTVDLVPPVTVEVIDTTGAGDAFNAGLAVALAEGQTLHDAVRFAVRCGAFACTTLGVIPALPHRHDIEPRRYDYDHGGRP